MLVLVTIWFLFCESPVALSFLASPLAIVLLQSLFTQKCSTKLLSFALLYTIIHQRKRNYAYSSVHFDQGDQITYHFIFQSKIRQLFDVKSKYITLISKINFSQSPQKNLSELMILNMNPWKCHRFLLNSYRFIRICNGEKHR